MRAVPATGGIELGPQDGPWIDIVPLQPSPQQGAGLAALADNLARRPGDWRHWRDPPQAASPAPLELTGVSAILGQPPALLVVFRWWERLSPADALQAIEEAEGTLPPSLACACLAAASASRRVRRGPALLATVAHRLAGAAPRVATPLPHDRVDEAAISIATALARGAPLPPLPGPAGLARCLLRLSRLLWHEGPAAEMRKAWQQQGQWRLLEQLAAAGAGLWGIKRAAWAAGAIDVPRGHEHAAWAAYADAAGTSMPRGAWRYLTGAGALLLDRTALGLAPPADAAPAWRSLAHALLEEARQRRRYALQGPYRIIVPREVARCCQARAVLLWAERDRLWAAIALPQGAVTRAAARKPAPLGAGRKGGSPPSIEHPVL